MHSYVFHIARASCQKGPTGHPCAWQIGPFLVGYPRNLIASTPLHWDGWCVALAESSTLLSHQFKTWEPVFCTLPTNIVRCACYRWYVVNEVGVGFLAEEFAEMFRQIWSVTQYDCPDQHTRTRHSGYSSNMGSGGHVWLTVDLKSSE